MRYHLPPWLSLLVILALATGTGGCGKSSAEGESSADKHGGSAGSGTRPSGGTPGGFGGRPPASSTAVPVEVTTVERRSISQYIQSNGTLEADNEVDIVARTSGPIEELLTEEGQFVRKGQLLARIDDDEIRSQVEIARVSLEETRLNYERAQRLHGNQLLSPEEFEQAKSRFETAKAQFQGNDLQLGYTKIRAPFAGRVVARYMDLAQQVSPNAPLFRLSDFDPLLCPVQIPERDLPKLALGQNAYLTVEAWPGERFSAKVLRLSPVIDSATGTVKVTLDVDARDKLRPGMFARVFLETNTHEAAVVIAKTALSLESLGDTIFVHNNGVAERRDVEIGFEEGDIVEILAGVVPGEEVVTVGQDGLSDGTPIQILGGLSKNPAMADRSADPGPGSSATPGGREPPGGRENSGAQGMPNPSQMTPEQLDQLKDRMRRRGLSEEQIEERLERMRERGRASGGTPTEK